MDGWIMDAELIITSSPFPDFSDPNVITSNRKHIVELFNFPPKSTIEVFHFCFHSIWFHFQSAIMTWFSHRALLYRFRHVWMYVCTIQHSAASLHNFIFICFNSQNEQISICYSNKSSSYFDCEAKVHEMIIIYVCILELQKRNSRWMPYWFEMDITKWI